VISNNLRNQTFQKSIKSLIPFSLLPVHFSIISIIVAKINKKPTALFNSTFCFTISFKAVVERIYETVFPEENSCTQSNQIFQRKE